MITLEAVEEYEQALKAGLKEARERTALGLSPNPAVLDAVLPNIDEYICFTGMSICPTDRTPPGNGHITVPH